MRALVQRITTAAVEVGDEVVGQAGKGLLVYLGVAATDSAAFAQRLAEKVANLRIFPDDQGALNLSVLDVGGEVLAVPNFTLMADARKGRRPSFAAAAAAEAADPLYEQFVKALKDCGATVASGSFGRHMHVNSMADGPVNILIEFPPDTQGGDSAAADN